MLYLIQRRASRQSESGYVSSMLNLISESHVLFLNLFRTQEEERGVWFLVFFGLPKL